MGKFAGGSYPSDTWQPTAEFLSELLKRNSSHFVWADSFCLRKGAGVEGTSNGGNVEHWQQRIASFQVY
jgi:hypothetical protein